MRAILAVALLLTAACGLAPAGEREPPAKDRRLGPPRHYDLPYFPWTPPATKAAWEIEKEQVRRRVLVANGLWPMPAKTPLGAVIHGKIERDGYTIEKVYFASYPGHYVTGSLYRPTDKVAKRPAVLSPHGHWANGRMYAVNDKEVEAQVKSGAEKTKESAKYFLQARCAQLARLGCVVFHYDMVGYADSQQIEHRKGFLDVEAELRLQSFMGLQTWNSVRALDFLAGLPDVDPARIGVTGASGGGTQTFILGAIDDRPAAAFPAVMVGTGMQGGCICENCSYLRIEGNNVEIAACMAPRPLGLSGANDWTKDVMKKGLPELKAVYKLYGAADNVMAEAFLQFGHNYNQVSREVMYNFFNKALRLGHEGRIREQPFVPVPPRELSVFDQEHPLPKDAVNAAGLRRYLTETSDAQIKALLPRDKASLAAFRGVMGPALEVMMTDRLPAAAEVETVSSTKPLQVDGNSSQDFVLSRKGAGEAVMVAFWKPAKWDGRVVVHVATEDGPHQSWKNLLGKNIAVCAVFTFCSNEPFGKEITILPAVNKQFAGYTFGYNRPLVAERAHDILTAVAWAKARKGVKSVDLVGFGEAGPWVALARGLCGDAVRRTAVDLNGFRFEQVKDANDPMMLPGALKYGGLLTLAALAAPHELLLHNTKGCGPGTFLSAAYAAEGHADRLTRREERMEPAAVVDWLLR